MAVEDGLATAFIIVTVILGLIFALINVYSTFSIPLEQSATEPDSSSIHLEDANLMHTRGHDSERGDREEKEPSHSKMSVEEICDAIAEGATSFLRTEYLYMSGFLVVFALLILITLGSQEHEADTSEISSWKAAFLTCVAFVLGAVTSVLCGYAGMKIAVNANGRTAVQAQYGFGPAFTTAYKAGAVMGFTLVSFGLLVLFITVSIFKTSFPLAFSDHKQTRQLFETVAGFGLGGSCVALFGRVGGGIYTKAADVGADLVGKVEQNIPEDDPRNPAVIADNVGDNVGDIAGMGADLFGSFAESTCAAMVLASQGSLYNQWAYMCYPMTISAAGLIGGFITTLFATNKNLVTLEVDTDVEKTLKRQLIVSTIVTTPLVLFVSWLFLPANAFYLTPTSEKPIHFYHAFFCVATGLWSGLAIGYFTEYFTSYSYSPVQQVANSCQTGAATNIIYGLSLGYLSTTVPTFCITLSIFISYGMAEMFGIALAALGMLSTLSIGLTIDAYGPISDNAGGIAEMAELGPSVRSITDCLDAAGNTTAAIGKGFAIGSAALVSLALFGAFVTTVNLNTVNLLKPLQFGGLLIGSMLPYWFSAMTMRSVGKAALAMVEEVRRQFAIPGILNGTERPQYAHCVKISTDASIREMIPPSCLVIFTPLIVGFFFGTDCLAGVLAGALTSGVQMAVSASNTGGAWDNAKKYIEKGHLGGKGSDQHKAAVIGDTVGDPLKDTSGPSLNILIKLMAIISLVMGPAFPTTGWLVRIFV